MQIKFFILFISIFLFQCSLKLDGDTFLTVEGVVTDSLNNPVENVNVVIKNTSSRFGEEVISATTSTDSYGKYRLIFPISNGLTEIGISGEPFSEEDLLNDFGEFSYNNMDNDLNRFFVYIGNRTNFTDYYFGADTIQIR